jgi:hypothetical protein
MGKSKRFIQQSKDSIKRHAEKFPYRLTFAESEQRKRDAHTIGDRL